MTNKNRKPRRGGEWFHKNFAFTQGANLISATILDTGMVLDEKKDSTIVRTLIDFVFGPSAEPGAAIAGMGITHMNADAHALLAFPDPAQDFVDDTDWLWVKPRVEHIRLAGGVSDRLIMEDIHSKRKYDDRNEVLVFVLETDAVSGTVFVQGFIRFFVLDPP